MNWIDEVNFNEEGLVPVIVQDVKTSRVLMLGWANREALESTVATGRGVYPHGRCRRSDRRGCPAQQSDALEF